eukprot:3547095-Alexandrium_andersonii.AAC.1
MQNRFRRSEPELRGPKNGLSIGPQSSREVPSVALSAQIPIPPEVAKSGRHGLQSAARNPWPLARERPIH